MSPSALKGIPYHPDPSFSPPRVGGLWAKPSTALRSGPAQPWWSQTGGTNQRYMCLLQPYASDSPMLACLRSLRRETSRMAVHGAPSSCSSLISFSATRLSVSRDLPLNTVAYVPCNQTNNSITNTSGDTNDWYSHKEGCFFHYPFFF